MDLERIRSEFPVLGRTFHGKPLVYLDSAATSQKPRSVIEAEAHFYSHDNANVRRGVYALSQEADARYEAAREHVARFLGADSAEEIVFLRGATEALNLVASTLGESRLRRGDRVVTTVMEHHSNIVPWHRLREIRGIDLQFVEITDDGRLRSDDWDRLLDQPTRVVAVTQASNVLGTVNPIREIAEKAHERGALVVVDAAQSAPHLPIDVSRLGADFVAFSGHKMLGPMGIGVLWGRAELLRSLPPYMGGGEMIREVHQQSVSFADPPARFEAGTPNVAGAVGLDAALSYLEQLGWESIADHERALYQQARRELAERLGESIHIFGPDIPEHRLGLLSFALEGVHPHDIASLLDADGIAVRAGHHCAQPLMERLRVPALARASPYIYTTPDEIHAFVESLVRIRTLFAR
ncbi:MAG: SufS family cysteine desulfurase [Thermoplasmata archaeon]|jgi:cysteine desulfurase/selenocysteine lyase